MQLGEPTEEVRSTGTGLREVTGSSLIPFLRFVRLTSATPRDWINLAI